MEGAPASPSPDGQPQSGQQMHQQILSRNFSRIKCLSIGGTAETGPERRPNRLAGCRQHTPDVRATTDVLARLTLNEADSWPLSKVHDRACAQLPSGNGRQSLLGDIDHLAVASSALVDKAVRSGDSASLLVSPSNSSSAEEPHTGCVKCASATSGVTQPVSQQVSDEGSISLSTEERISHLAYLASRQSLNCRDVTATPTEADEKTSPFCEPLVKCKKSLQIRGSNVRRRLSVSGDIRTMTDSSGHSSVQPLSCGEWSSGSHSVGEWHRAEIQTASGRDSRIPWQQGCETPAGPRGVAGAVEKYGVLPLVARLNTPSCSTGVRQLGGRCILQQGRPHVRPTCGFDVVANEAQAAEAGRPTERLFWSSATLGRLKRRKKRSLSSPAGRSPSDNDPKSTEDRGQSRTVSRVASLASVARSCMHRRVSAGTGKGSGTPLLAAKDSRSAHRVFFTAHSSGRRSFQKFPTENGSATEASENGKTASSRTSSSGTITEKCTPYLAGEFEYHEYDTSKVAELTEVEKKQLHMRVGAAALGEASVMVFGVPQVDSHDRRLIHRIDPAKLLRVSCSKCFSDEQARQTRFSEVNRPIVCDEGSSTRYFRKKGEASGAPGSWPAGDSGSTIISRRLACMLVREVQREVRYGFYPVCTRVSMMWASLLGSIVFLSIGAWLTVEDERHVECRLNYEDETLQEGGSRYSLLSITADLCSGRLHTIRLNTARSDEKNPVHESSKKGSRRGSTVDEEETRRDPEGSSDLRRSRRRSTTYGYAGRESQFEGPFPDDPRSGSIRKKVPRRRAMGYSASSSAPLSYFFSLPPPTPQPLPRTEETTSVISELTGPYIYVYIEMDRFYQNDAQVLWSRKDEQLAGKVFTDPRDLKECEPAVTAVIDNVTKVLHPCGVLAWNVFTDRFQFLDAVPDDSIDAGPVRPLVLEQNQDVLLSSFGDWRKRFKNPPADVRARYRDRVYFWMSLSDNDDGKDMYKTREEAKAELLMDRLNYEEAGDMVENGHFIQWMHTAPFGTWRKFYGRIRGPVKLPLFAYIAVTYDVKQWRGRKAIVLVQPSRFNGRTQFLGSAYLVFGCILAIVASYMIWRKWFYITEEEVLDCAQDLRWRTQRKRRGKTR